MARPDRALVPGPALSPIRRTIRYWVSRLAVTAVIRGYLRVRLDGHERLPAGPAIYCFNHLSWSDPFVLMAVLPFRPRLWFFGPKEEDMGVGGRNRLMTWTGSAIPYKPGKNDLLDVTHRVGAVISTGAVVAIAGLAIVLEPWHAPAAGALLGGALGLGPGPARSDATAHRGDECGGRDRAAAAGEILRPPE